MKKEANSDTNQSWIRRNILQAPWKRLFNLHPLYNAKPFLVKEQQCHYFTKSRRDKWIDTITKRISLIGWPIHSALCHIEAKSFVNYNY